MDEVQQVKIEEQKNYSSRKGKTYEFLKSNPAKWQPAYIKGYLLGRKGKEVPVYHIGSIKRTMTESGAFHIELVNDAGEYKHVKTPYSDASGCELCGHYAIDLHILINYEEKQFMNVGCECINNHYGAVVRKQIKIFKDNETRKEFSELREKVILILDTKLDIKEGNSAEYVAYVKRTGRLEYWAYMLKKELQKIIVNETGSRKLKNLIEKMKKVN